MFMKNKYDHRDMNEEEDDDDDNSVMNSPPSCLIALSPNTPILHFNPFGYKICLYLHLFHFLLFFYIKYPNKQQKSN